MEVIKVSKYEYRLGGDFTYNEVNYRSVVVDGEIYHRTDSEQVTINLCDDFNGDRTLRWDMMEYDDLENYGITIKIWDLLGFNDFDELSHPLELAIDLNDIDNKFIKCIHYGKNSISGYNGMRKFYEQCIINNQMIFPISFYGFNNSINIYMPLNTFVKTPFNKHNADAQRFLKDLIGGGFPDKYYESKMNSKDEVILLRKLFNKQIRMKTHY